MQAVRYMAASGLSLALEVYDGNDTLVASVPMAATAIAGVYRADVSVSLGDIWGIVVDAQGVQLDMVRITPSAQSIAAEIIGIMQDPEMLTVSKFIGIK